MHSLARETGHGLIGVIVTRRLFGSVALNAKAGVRATVEKRSHRLNDADPAGSALRWIKPLTNRGGADTPVGNPRRPDAHLIQIN
jgi:hypothetical protein